jgi:hypothetical protein
MSRERCMGRVIDALDGKPVLPLVPMVAVNAEEEMRAHWSNTFENGGVCFVREDSQLWAWVVDRGDIYDCGEWVSLSKKMSKIDVVHGLYDHLHRGKK